MSDIDQLVSSYLSMWNDTDSAHRRTVIDAIWEPTGQYVDPVNDATGPEQLNAMVTGFQAQFPNVAFRRTGPIDAHHQLARFTWEFGPEGGDPIATGTDVLVHTAQGHLTKVYGFFDSPA
jgi:hypothetical protein